MLTLVTQLSSCKNATLVAQMLHGDAPNTSYTINNPQHPTHQMEECVGEVRPETIKVCSIMDYGTAGHLVFITMCDALVDNNGKVWIHYETYTDIFE